jgi:hypothetical protein
MKKQYVPASSFWMDDWDDDELYTPSNPKEAHSKDLYRLASHKRAISNFTTILTGQNIPVQFHTSGGSYTDGKSITISANITEAKEFDVAVGLALHEASHIKLTDFKLLQYLHNEISAKIPSQLIDKVNRTNINSYSIVKDILNIVEDRRIDNFVFQSSPGYREYYRTLYDKYFNDKLIDTALQSDEMCDETVESYMFRLTNIHSQFTNLSALKRLPEIYRLIDLGNIGRLKTTSDSLEVSLKIFEIIVEAIDEQMQLENNKKASKPKSPDDEIDMGETPELTVRSYANSTEEEDEKEESDEDESGEDTDEKEGDTSDSDKLEGVDSSDDSSSDVPSSGGLDTDAGRGKSLSTKQKELLKKKIKKQKDFLNGDISRKAVSKADNNQINAIAESDTSIEIVGDEWHRGGVECIFVKNMTRSLMETDSFPLTHRGTRSEMAEGKETYLTKFVADGISRGTILGKKLQLRGESRDTVFNRQKVGKLDRRMISSLGFGNENVFFSREVDQYKKANLHISIDASGSMGGTKWQNTMVNVVALAKAVDMISNLNIQISFRTTTSPGRNTELPYVVIAYDSRKDKFSKVKSLFQYLIPSGTTPEGLCFEAMMDKVIPSTTESDSYFMNISDGEPYFNSYSGEVAATHTYKQITKLQNMGIRVLSYFVGDGYTSRSIIFEKSYGKTAAFINVTNMVEVSKTMNRMFLSK